jgi:beta-phosphoglucomutase-like phosphatase (HAD superfamily)
MATILPVRVTPKEASVLEAIATSEYRNSSLEEPVWTFDLFSGPGAGGVVASLKKKGLIVCSGSGTSEACASLTPAGISTLPQSIRTAWSHP